MSPTLFSLLAVTLGFTALVTWVFWPSNKARMERHGSMPLDDEPPASAPHKEQTR